MKKLLVSILMLGLMFNVSCTSKNDTDSDQQTAEATDPALDVEGADAAAGMDASTETSTDDFAEDEVVADTGDVTSEELPDQTLAPEAKGAEGEEVLLSDDGSTPTDTVTGTESADGSITDSTGDVAMDSSIESSTDSSLDTAATDTSTDTSLPVDTGAGYSEPKPQISVKKIKDIPFNQGGALLNTVYLARQGDDIASISTKIYGSDRSADLLAANPHLKKGVKVGDKVYYNSPKRPQDAERMLTFYEDNGIPAQTYVAKSGENIRKVSKNLLGDKNSWKEVWATNLAVESKSDLAEGTELRYWTDSAPSLPMADAAAPDMMEPAPADLAQNTPPPAPQDDFAMPDDMNQNNGMAGTVAAEPPPPPPPPAPQASKQVASAEKDMTFMLSAGGLLLVGVGVILAVMRRSRSRKISMNTNTQI